MVDESHPLGTDEKNSIVVVVTSGSEYRNAVNDVIGFSKDFKKPCYVTLNEPFEKIRGLYGNKKLLIVDCVTSTVKTPPDDDEVLFVSSPKSLTEISIAIQKSFDDFGSDFLIFDSISTLMVYEKSVRMMKFIHNMILKLRGENANSILIVMKDDMGDDILKDLSMFVDKVIEV